VTGLAWDGGHGLDSVAISTDGGRSWQPADLGEDLGRYAFRAFAADVQARTGTLTILSRASNRSGQTQVPKALFNPAGYHNNVYNAVSVTVA
jgi:sulfite dehydrogenase